jgi:hypothetical protein
MKQRITEVQLASLRSLDENLEDGAGAQLQVLIDLLEEQLAQEVRELSCETSEPVTQLVNYESSFDKSDKELGLLTKGREITDANFKASDVIKSFEHGSATRIFKVYRPKRNVSPGKVLALMKKDGYRPATPLEMLEYYLRQRLYLVVTYQFTLVALGTVWEGKVVCMNLNPVYCNLGLTSLLFGRVFDEDCEFLAVRETEQA